MWKRLCSCYKAASLKIGNSRHGVQKHKHDHTVRFCIPALTKILPLTAERRKDGRCAPIERINRDVDDFTYTHNFFLRCENNLNNALSNGRSPYFYHHRIVYIMRSYGLMHLSNCLCIGIKCLCVYHSLKVYVFLVGTWPTVYFLNNNNL